MNAKTKNADYDLIFPEIDPICRKRGTGVLMPFT